MLSVHGERLLRCLWCVRVLVAPFVCCGGRWRLAAVNDAPGKSAVKQLEYHRIKV